MKGALRGVSVPIYSYNAHCKLSLTIISPGNLPLKKLLFTLSLSDLTLENAWAT